MDLESGSRAGDRRRIKGDASRARILDAAVELFAERGYAATGVYEIARRAGIEKAALYWHFGSKAALLAAVIDRTHAEFIDWIVARVSEASTSDERLDRFVGGLERLAAQRGQMVRMMLGVAIEGAQSSPDVRAAIRAVCDRTRAVVIEGFAQALGVPLPDADLIARLALAYLEEASVRAVIDPDGAEHGRFFAHLRRLIALDVTHQVRQVGAPVAPERLPTCR